MDILGCTILPTKLGFVKSPRFESVFSTLNLRHICIALLIRTNEQNNFSLENVNMETNK